MDEPTPEQILAVLAGSAPVAVGAQPRRGQKNRAGGQKVKCDDETKAKVLGHILEGLTVAKSAVLAGTSQRTVFRHASEDPAFGAKLRDAIRRRGVMRPSRFGPGEQAEYCQRVRNGETKSAAARAVGLDPSTVHLFRETHPEFAEDERTACEEANDLIEDALFLTARDGNVIAQQVWLYNRNPERWRDKRNVQITGKNEGPVEMVVADPALDRLTQALERIERRQQAAEAGLATLDAEPIEDAEVVEGPQALTG